MIEISGVQKDVRYIDGDGKLTTEGFLLFQEMSDAIVELQSEKEALEARIAALE